METNTNPTHKEVKLNQTLKIFLKRAIVHVAITNVEGGEDQRQLKAIGDKGDSTEEKLFKAYHGDPTSGITSFLDTFMQMRGEWQAFLNKGYAFVDENDVVKIDLSKMLFIPNGCLTLDTHIRNELRKSTGSQILSGRTMMDYKRQNIREVKPLQDLVRQFCNGSYDEELPSGKNLEQLFSFIWNEMWKRKNAKNSSAKASTTDSIESEEFGDDTELPDSEQNNPTLASYEGKWYPPGWHVFFLFVCKHTRINENYHHLFQYDGKGLDSSNASNRKQARQKKHEQNEKRRKTELAAGFSRGMNIDEIHQSIHLNMKMSKEKRDEINEDIAQRLAHIANLQNQIQSLYQLLGQIKPSSEEFFTHPLYVETQRLSEKIEIENKVIEEKRKGLETLKNNDVYGKKAEDDLLKLHSLDSPAPVGKVSIHAQTPVSILSDINHSTFAGGQKLVAYEIDDMNRPADEGRSLHDDCNILPWTCESPGDCSWTMLGSCARCGCE